MTDMYHLLQEHAGHYLRIVTDGDMFYPHTVSIECTQCGTVLFEVGDADDDYDMDEED